LGRNTQRDLRAALDRAGYHWATSHSCHKTVATLMDEARLSARVQRARATILNVFQLDHLR
jgi:hypothetical protein